MSGQLACVTSLFILFKETCYFCLTVFVQGLDTFQHQKDFNHLLLTQEINPNASVTSGMHVSSSCRLLVVSFIGTLHVKVL